MKEYNPTFVKYVMKTILIETYQSANVIPSMPVKKKSFIVHTAIYLSVDAMQRIGMNGFAKRKTKITVQMFFM